MCVCEYVVCLSVCKCVCMYVYSPLHGILMAPTFMSFTIYIYIYVCVCVCVCNYQKPLFLYLYYK